ncbi:hypothetical protein EDC30_11163 [Paucimonas lemoignei]|uniref:Uncharacterized protein n=1 Tax=Paucimonas lemoignei TaxID=29443 RepID=A0A4V6NXX7_PAULE|nr:hypothetical protein EDC30_11163 [Paucimonas lemoignei]
MLHSYKHSTPSLVKRLSAFICAAITELPRDVVENIAYQNGAAMFSVEKF